MTDRISRAVIAGLLAAGFALLAMRLATSLGELAQLRAEVGAGKACEP